MTMQIMVRNPFRRYLQSSSGLFTFAKINPESMDRLFDHGSLKVSADEGWTIISLVPAQALKPAWWNPAVGAMTSGFVLICVFSYYLASLRIRRDRDAWQLAKDEKELRGSKEELETRVIERTKDLKSTNEILEIKIENLEKTKFELQKLSLAIEQSPSTVVITDLEGNVR